MPSHARPRLRPLNTALVLSFGSAVALWGAAAAAQQQQPQAAAPSAAVSADAKARAALPAVTVKDSAEDDNGRVSGYSARRSRTGSKTDTPIIETPQSVSVVTADRIEAIGATTVRDALGYTPGINISPYGADSRYDWLNIRGFDAYARASTRTACRCATPIPSPPGRSNPTAPSASTCCAARPRCSTARAAPAAWWTW